MVFFFFFVQTYDGNHKLLRCYLFLNLTVYVVFKYASKVKFILAVSEANI